MNDALKVGLVLILIVIPFVIAFIYIDSFNNSFYHDACKDLGYSKSKFLFNIDACEDINNSLHYVKMQCDGLIWKNCVAKEISVGGVRVVKYE